MYIQCTASLQLDAILPNEALAPGREGIVFAWSEGSHVSLFTDPCSDSVSSAVDEFVNTEV